MELLTYLFKVTVCSTLLFAFYRLFLSKLTFYKLNRIYLLSALIFSLVIPLLKFNVNSNSPVAWAANKNAETITHVTVQNLKPIILNPSNEFSATSILIGIYSLISFTIACIGIFNIIKFFGSARNESIHLNKFKIVFKEKGITNCSFFNYIFINPKNLTTEEIKLVVHHEQLHAYKFHSIDKLFLFICKIFFWFNPIIYLYNKELELIHEYEVDALTTNHFSINTYANLLLKLATNHQKPFNVVHNFSNSPIKERINRLFIQQSRNNKKWLYLPVVLLVSSLCLLFTIRLAYANPVNEQHKPFVLILDAGHGGTNFGAVVGNMTEKDLSLSILKKVKILADKKGISTVLTRKEDEEVSLANRISFKGDFLISLHSNSDLNKNKNGIQVLMNRTEDHVKNNQLDLMTYELIKNFNGLKGIQTDLSPKNTTGLYILKNNPVPSILLEIGYMSNNKDLAFLSRQENQEIIAQSIIQSVENYRLSSAY